MDADWERDSDEIVDPEVTGDPQLDQFGYQSPRGGNRTEFRPGTQVDWLAQAKRDRQRRAARRDRQRQAEKARRQRELPPSPPAQRPQPMAQPAPSRARA